MYAAAIRTGTTLVALPARQEDLDRHAIAGADVPSSRGHRSDLFDDADGFVSGNERVPREQLASELLVVGPAEPAGFDTQERVVVADLRPRELANGKRSRCFQDGRADHGTIVPAWCA